jgi:hypothetical protein
MERAEYPRGSAYFSSTLVRQAGRAISDALLSADTVESVDILDTLKKGRNEVIVAQRQASEAVNEHDTGQWSDSRVTRWIADGADQVVRLDSN